MSNAASQSAPRILYLDNLRNVLMLLGVAIHSAQLFRSYTPNAIQLGPSSPIFDYITDVIHAFRLPAFFLIAGFVGSSVIRARGSQTFLSRRLVRIGVPFLVTLLTLNVIEALLPGIFIEGFSERWTWEVTVGLVAQAFRKGNLLHLWFLPTLLLYSVILSLLLRFKSIVRSLRTSVCLSWIEERGIYVLLLPLSLVILDVTAWPLIPHWKQFGWTQLPDPVLLLHYLPFFLFGAVAQNRPVLWNNFGNTLGWFSFAIVGIVITGLLSFSRSITVSSYSRMTLEGFVNWTLVAIALRVAAKVLDSALPGVLRIPDVSYSVYLVHHFFVTLLAILLIEYDISGKSSFLAVMLGAGGLSIVAAQIISRNPLLRFAFNGRTKALVVS